MSEIDWTKITTHSKGLDFELSFERIGRAIIKCSKELIEPFKKELIINIADKFSDCPLITLDTDPSKNKIDMAPYEFTKISFAENRMPDAFFAYYSVNNLETYKIIRLILDESVLLEHYGRIGEYDRILHRGLPIFNKYFSELNKRLSLVSRP